MLVFFYFLLSIHVLSVKPAVANVPLFCFRCRKHRPISLPTLVLNLMPTFHSNYPAQSYQDIDELQLDYKVQPVLAGQKTV